MKFIPEMNHSTGRTDSISETICIWIWIQKFLEEFIAR